MNTWTDLSHSKSAHPTGIQTPAWFQSPCQVLLRRRFLLRAVMVFWDVLGVVLIRSRAPQVGWSGSGSLKRSRGWLGSFDSPSTSRSEGPEGRVRVDLPRWTRPLAMSRRTKHGRLPIRWIHHTIYHSYPVYTFFHSSKDQLMTPRPRNEPCSNKNLRRFQKSSEGALLKPSRRVSYCTSWSSQFSTEPSLAGAPIYGVCCFLSCHVHPSS